MSKESLKPFINENFYELNKLLTGYTSAFADFICLSFKATSCTVATPVCPSTMRNVPDWAAVTFRTAQGCCGRLRKSLIIFCCWASTSVMWCSLRWYGWKRAAVVTVWIGPAVAGATWMVGGIEVLVGIMLIIALMEAPGEQKSKNDLVGYSSK